MYSRGIREVHDDLDLSAVVKHRVCASGGRDLDADATAGLAVCIGLGLMAAGLDACEPTSELLVEVRPRPSGSRRSPGDVTARPSVIEQPTRPVEIPQQGACCVYSPAGVAAATDFSFAGTGADSLDVVDLHDGEGLRRPIRFRVDEWFAGGIERAVTVDFEAGPTIDEAAPPAEIGNRVLVSGRRPDKATTTTVLPTPEVTAITCELPLSSTSAPLSKRRVGTAHRVRDIRASTGAVARWLLKTAPGPSRADELGDWNQVPSDQ